MITPTNKFMKRNAPKSMNAMYKMTWEYRLSYARMGCMWMAVASTAAYMMSTQPSVVEISKRVAIASPTLLKFW